MVNILDYNIFIFDLDGVIIDSEQTHYSCYKEAISNYSDVILDWNTYCKVHHSIDTGFKDLFRDNYNDIYSFKTKLYSQSIANIQLKEGFYDFFKLLIKYGKQICIVTDASRSIFNLIANKYKFLLKSNVIITRDDTSLRKPNSDGYLQIVKRYSDMYELHEFIAFEDSYKGWVAATNVIYNCVLVNNQDYYYYNVINANNSINDFTSIQEYNYKEPIEFVPFYISSKTKHRTRWLSMKPYFPIFANWIEFDKSKDCMTNIDKSMLCETIKYDTTQCSFGILYTEEGECDHIGSLIEIGMLLSQSKQIYLCGDNIFKNEILFNFKSLINFSYANNSNLFQSFRRIQYDINTEYNIFKTNILSMCKNNIEYIQPVNTIDYVVICASGKGTRLLPITKHIPKLLVNINNDCILHNIINYWKQYSNKFTVIIDSDYNDLVRFYLNLMPGIEYEIINVDCRNGEENSYTIHKALCDVKYINTKLLITWCDIFPTSYIPNDLFADNNIIFTYKNFGRYDAYDNRIEKKIMGNIIGIYYFSKFSQLTDFNPNMDICDCYKNNFGDFITYEIYELTDIGDYTKLCKYISDNPYKTRFFNKIYETSVNELTKMSTCKYGNKIITDEMLFYKFHNLNNVPKIIEFNENKFTMLKIKGKPLIDAFNNARIPKQFEMLQSIIDNLKYIHNQESYDIDRTVLNNDIKLEFYQKVNNRIQNIRPLLYNFHYIKSINGVHIRHSYEHIIQNVYSILCDYFNNNVQKYHTIHGDPHLSNILIDDNEKIWFIDPRGYFGNTKLFGIKEYDISKIIYSLSGFDEINNNDNHFFVINENNIDVNITNNMNNYIFLFNEYNTKILICMTILHWFGLTDYAKNNVHKCISAYYYGIYLYHVYYKDINTV
jgi:beta-phosphoglucomutase-like phosphatase (HAD superfamily)